MFWRAFRKSPSQPQAASWWRDADAAAESVSPAEIERLHASITHSHDDPDDAERQEEMIDGLRHLASIAGTPDLPVIVTQHRVIGPDRCHYVTPASVTGDVSSPGKLFLTADRLVFAGGRVSTWPWHRVQDVMRSGRHVIVILTGGAEGLSVQCNTYGEAMIVRHLGLRLRQRPARQSVL